ncbi:MAG: hypothetical protein ABFS21_09195 [Actinomycetota bacterium]
MTTVAAMLIAVDGSRASADPDGKTYTATITPSEVTAGDDVLFTLAVTDTSSSTPLGAVNLTVPPEFELTTPPAIISAPDGATSWSASMSGRTIELRAAGSSERLGYGETVEATFGAIGLQEFIGSELWVDYSFLIEARQANSFNGDPGNGLTYIGADPAGPVVRVIGVAKHCTDQDCTLSQALGTTSAGTFTVIGTCELSDCGVVKVDLVSDGENLADGEIAYTPAPDSSDVRAYLTLLKTVLDQSPNQYSFDLYNDDGSIKAADLDKCRRGETNCLEQIDRTKVDVTWIFRVDSFDPLLDYG